jgi:predicted GH43/DUF377 family glycosyl hydrolase
MSTVKITNIGFETLAILVRYMSEFVGEDEALVLGDNLIDVATQKLESFPVQCPICHELDLLGVTDYRQVTIDDSYKVLYRYDASNDESNVMAFMRQRQSAQELLIQYLLRSNQS